MSRCNECEHVNVCIDYSPLTIKFVYHNGYPCKHFSKKGYTLRLPTALNLEQLNAINSLVKIWAKEDKDIHE